MILDESASTTSSEGRSALELVAFTPDDTRTWELPPRGEVTIGRAEENQVRLEHSSVSRHHARLVLSDSIRIEDLGGANGTFVPDRGASDGDLQTVALRRLLRQSAEIGIGENVMLGQVTIAVRPRQVVSHFEDLSGEAGATGGVIVRDAAMRAVYAEAERAAQAPITLLILGETGVGKEVLARAVHARSPRGRKAFLGVNCAAFSETLLESELFGHEQGAFTGALRARPGIFEATAGGTVFLDEVGEMSLSTQVKLLRVLEDRTVMRLGARSPKPIDVRFIAATNRDLEADVRAGRFRQDLYFRLNGLCLTIPPLRERRAEIEPLVQRFLATACAKLGGPPPKFSAEALRVLEGYAWPGNVRELRNVVERGVVLCNGTSIEVRHLPPSLLAAAAQPSAPGVALPVSSPAASNAATLPPEPRANLPAERRALERARVVDALERCGGNQTRAAELLGISRRTLVSWLDEFGIPRPRKP